MAMFGRGRSAAKKKQASPLGELRKSQLLGTYGPGAMVDLPNAAVIVGGTEYWRAGAPVVEERFARYLRKKFEGAEDLPFELNEVTPFRAPPVVDDAQEANVFENGVQVRLFPRWMICQRCRRLEKLGANNLELNDETGEVTHRCGPRGHSGRALPMRFVLACKRGHLADLNWPSIVHAPGCRGKLYFEEHASGALARSVVRCRKCGESRSIGQLQSHGELKVRCGLQDNRPWRGERDETCKEFMRLTNRGSSAIYCTRVMSAVSIPDPGGSEDEELLAKVRQNWNLLEFADAEDIGKRRQRDPKFAAAFTGVSDERVVELVESVKSPQLSDEVTGLRTAEFHALTSSPYEVDGERPRRGEVFFARRVRDIEHDALSHVVLVEKLREVRALLGFSRLDTPVRGADGEYDLDVSVQPPGAQDWLPAVDVMGEGVFVALDEARVVAWEESEPVRARTRVLEQGFKAWAESRSANVPFPGARYYLVHSLAHMLMVSLAMKCGYAVSGLKERVYAAPADACAPMAGLMITTSGQTAEGTLGGLAREGRAIVEHIHNAVEQSVLCSQDPLCAAHSPILDERHLEGAACHSCLFLAETSCESFNHMLDRTLVVPTVEDREVAFFGQKHDRS